MTMEKKEYIEPSMIVRHIDALVMAALSDPHNEEGGDDQLSRENFMMDETGTQSSLHINDVWED